MKRFFFVICLVLAFTGCKEQASNEKPDSPASLSGMIESSDMKEKISSLRRHNILFGHQSVGSNIIEGIKTIAQQSGEAYQIANLDEVGHVPKAHLVEFSPGQNRDPKSKIDGFVEKMSTLPAGFSPHVAFLKFCYIDISPASDLADIMNYYKEKIDVLKRQHPDVLFLHSTVPLTARSTDLKSRIKRFLGKQDWHDASNIARSRYNRLLHETFPDDPIFDLALNESTRIDGTIAEFTYRNIQYPYLADEYTNDGGHLNALGQIVVAKNLISFFDALPLSH